MPSMRSASRQRRWRRSTGVHEPQIDPNPQTMTPKAPTRTLNRTCKQEHAATHKAREEGVEEKVLAIDALATTTNKP